MKKLKKLIKENLTDTTLNINNRYVKIKAIACFWVKENFSGIIQYYGKKYYCYYNRELKDIVIENA